MNFSQMGMPNKDVFLTQDETNILIEAEKVEREERYATLSKSKLLPELYAAAAAAL
jgi:hypothetical protein